MTTPLKPRRRIWPWIVAGCLAPWLLLAAAAWSIITPVRELAALRDQLVINETGDWRTQVQLDVGAGSLTLARTILHFVQHEDIDKARAALAAVRRASVGVYLRNPESAHEVPGLVGAAEAKLESRGWTKVIKVVEPDTTVLVYHQGSSGRTGEFCVAVIEPETCVLVYAKLTANEMGELVGLARASIPELQHL